MGDSTDDFQEQQAETDHLYVPAAAGHQESDNFITKGFAKKKQKNLESFRSCHVYIRDKLIQDSFR